MPRSRFPDHPFALSAPDDDVVESRASGKRVRFEELPEDPGEDPMRFEMWLAPDGHGPMRHVHPEQDELLEVVSGRLGVWVDGDSHVLTDGERVTIPAGTPHRFWNAGEWELHLRGGVWPGLRTEQFMRVTYGLDRDGAPTTPSGMPLNVLRLSVLLDEYDDMLWLAGVPVALQRLGVRALAPLGRYVGYDNDYPEYLSGE